ncbi:MAG: flavin reductase family protein [Rhodoblastus sp.]
MHHTHEPAILYFGTPVVLLSTLNADGSPNLAPMSSVFWLGWRCMIGLDASSRTTENIRRTGQCVMNLPSADQAAHVDRIALTTGSDPVPSRKRQRGYRFEANKFGCAGFTPAPSEAVAPPRALECPVHLEATLEGEHGLAQSDPYLKGAVVSFELRILRAHIDDAIMMDGEANRVDPDKWRPLIMSFQKFYGLGPQLQPSRLASVPEAAYRSPDVDRARAALARAG